MRGSMHKDNKWRHETMALAMGCPPTPRRKGVRFNVATVDPEVGDETFVTISDDPAFAAAYAKTRPFNLHATQGLIRTSHGIVMFIVWTVAAGSPNEAMMEHFLDPKDRGTMELLASLGQQSHLKALVVNIATNEVVDWFEFQNVYGFADSSALITDLVRNEAPGNFGAAVQEAMSLYDTPDLLALAEGKT